MANLFDVDCGLERSLLSIITFEADTMLGIVDAVSCSWRVMAVDSYQY